MIAVTAARDGGTDKRFAMTAFERFAAVRLALRPAARPFAIVGAFLMADLVTLNNLVG
jgi:hypothetical protein